MHSLRKSLSILCNYICIIVFDIKEVKRGGIKIFELFNFHPILMQFLQSVHHYDLLLGHNFFLLF